MDRRAIGLLWFDSLPAVVAGVGVLALRGPLAELHGLPVGLLTVMGVVNLLYASYSGTLAARASAGRPPPRAAVDLLIAANLAWTVVCVGIAAATWRTAAWTGTAQVLGEGVWVASLAAAEARWVRPAARA